ncbi:MAG: lysylphosphatidylglycerol synthase transmembrane domain-containing protein [Myxococcota bacterium]
MAELPTESSDTGKGGPVGAWVVGVVVSGLFLGGLLGFAEPRKVWSIARSADAVSLFLACGCYVGVLVARWFRLFAFQDTTPKTHARIELLWVSASHSFVTQLLPARLGEFVFPSLWHRATDQPHADGLVALLAVRLVELAVLAPIFGVSLFAWLMRGGEPSGGAMAGWIPWVATALGLALLIGLPLVLHGTVGAASWLIERRPLRNWRVLDPLQNSLPEARVAVERMNTRNLVWITGSTIVMWIGLFGVYGFVLRACGAPMGWIQTVVGSTGGIVGNLLPVGGIGSLGVMEAGWTAAFRATGAPLEPVVAAGLLVHALVIVGAGLGAGVGQLADWWQTRQG